MQKQLLHRLATLIALVLLALVPLATPPARVQAAPAQQPAEPTFVDPELTAATKDGKQTPVLVTLRSNFQVEGTLSQEQANNQRATIQQAQQAVANRVTPSGGTVKHMYASVPVLALWVNAEALKTLSNAPEVARIDQDKQNTLQLTDSVPQIGGPKARSYGATGAGQTIAILDTGVDKFHPFLSGKIVAEGCFSTQRPDQGIISLCPGGVTRSTAAGSGINCPISLSNGCVHGTHVAGIAAGKIYRLPTGIEIAGVAPEATIIALQVFSANMNTNGITASDSDIIAALDYIYSLRNTYKIASVNLSLGGSRYTQPCSNDPITIIINQLQSAGIATVISSGNEGYTNELAWPACAPNAISVGSTGATSDAVSYFSNSASFLSMLAPGERIYSSVPGGGFASLSGTSMAAPHVAGAWAAIKSLAPQASVLQLKNTLIATGVQITDGRNNIIKARIQVNAVIRSLGLATAPNDFNGNRRSDILWRHGGNGLNVIYLMNGISIDIPYTLNQVADQTWQVVGTGDFNGDRHTDILWRNSSSGMVTICFMNNGYVTSWPIVMQSSETRWRIIGTGDFDGNGLSEIVWRSTTDGQVKFTFINGSQVVREAPVAQAGSNWQLAGIGDLNGDGRSDLVWRNSISGQNELFLMKGSTLIRQGTINTVGDLQWRIVGVEDFDGNGRDDLLWYHASTGTVVIYFMNGFQVLSQPTIGYMTDLNSQLVSTGDFNGDGRGDMLWRHQVSGLNYMYLMNGAVFAAQGAVNYQSDLRWRVVNGGSRSIDGVAPNSYPGTSSGAAGSADPTSNQLEPIRK